MGKHVLLVDDSTLITSNLRQFLSDIKGIGRIDSAATLRQAKRSMEADEADIVVLDISLREENGIDFLRWVKFLYPSTTVIMFSNLTDDAHRAAAQCAGAAHFFDKSFDAEKIYRVLEEIAA